MNPKRRTLYIAATITWMAVIFYYSSVPDLKSGFPTLWDTIFRKAAHMVEYGILYLLIWQSADGVRGRRWIAFVVALLYAMSDEWHQSFVEGRSGNATDVLIDFFGMAGAWAWTSRRQKNRPR